MTRFFRSLPVRLACAAVVAAGAQAPLQAQTPTYPTKPIQLIVPFSVGGDADQSARNLQTLAQQLLGQPVLVVNKPGASGAIGSQLVRDAAPDGYTLLMARTGPQAILPALQPKSLGYKWNEFTFIGMLDLNPVVCVVNVDSPHKSIADLTKALIDKPGKLSYSTSGPATTQSLAPQLLLSLLGLKPDAALNVPYKGGGEVTMAVISKEVDFACNNFSSLAGQINGGKLRALLTTTPKRLEKHPDIPTAREAGYPQLEAVLGWSALYGPPKMDPAAVKRWTAVLKQLSEDPKWIAGNATFGGIPSVMSAADTENFVSDSYATYQALVQKTGMEIK